jgi:membrane-bound lytic murein transglycosylase D
MTLPLPSQRLRQLLATGAAIGLLAGCASLPAPESETRSEPAPVVASAPVVPVSADPPAATASATAPAASAPDDGSASASPAMEDPLRPEVRLDPNDVASQSDLWERIRAGFGMSDLATDLVRNRERWYAAQPDYIGRMTERGSLYLFHIVEEVNKRGMPTELALLPFIESAFNPQAYSRAAASGMWQFIPSTGRIFDLTQNVFRDDRRDVLASTRAALDYLAKLHGMFGDWHLALAAYNCGEGCVARAIARNRNARKPINYASLRLPNETKWYVPKFQAMKNIVARPADFGITLPLVANHPSFVAVPIERDIDVEVAAELAEMSIDDFRALNPQMNKPVILAAGTPRLLLPYDNANTFLKKLPEYDGKLASWTAWLVPTTLKPAEAARQTGMSEDDLREVNRIPPGVLIRAGSTLLVPRNGHRADVPEHVADNAMLHLTMPARRVTLRAGHRDTVAGIARRYKVAAGDVAQWNGLPSSATFRAGQTIVLHLPPRAVSTRKATPPKRTSVRAAAPAAKRKTAAVAAR